MNERYILNENGLPIPCEDLMEWARWMQFSDRKVAFDIIGNVKVSTVFLGLDHSFSLLEDGIPVLYETMIFGGKHDQYQERYSTPEEALIGHEVAVKLVRN